MCVCVCERERELPQFDVPLPFSCVQSMRYEEEADVKPFVVVEVVHKVCVAVN